MPDQAVILIAEDKDEDIELLRHAFVRAEIPNPIHVVKDGAETIAYLQGEGKYSNRDEYPLPALLLLDLNMPRTDGFEVLMWLRREPGLSNLRVIVLTASSDMQDINRAYDLGANSYLVKPHAIDDLMRVVERLEKYWLEANKSPDCLAA